MPVLDKIKTYIENIESAESRISMAVFQDFRSYSTYLYKIKPNFWFEIYTEYSPSREDKSRQFSRNYLDWFSKEKLSVSGSLRRRKWRYVVSYFGKFYYLMDKLLSELGMRTLNY